MRQHVCDAILIFRDASFDAVACHSNRSKCASLGNIYCKMLLCSLIERVMSLFLERGEREKKREPIEKVLGGSMHSYFAF